jgi:XTP/dITP diphosphohydrolase
MLRLNTSNFGKFEEFKGLFASHGIELDVSHLDVSEIDADPIQVAVHKAGQLGEGILVDDTSLHVSGASVGVNVRWLLSHLTDYTGAQAEWTVLLAHRQGNEVFVYKGSVSGTIVAPRCASPKGFGFDPIFLPEGAELTLAESKPDCYSARAKAVEAFVKGDIYAKHPLIEQWKGPWQNE